MSFESSNDKKNNNEMNEEMPRGSWVKAFISLTNGAIEVCREKGKLADKNVLSKVLDIAGDTQKSLEKFDPDNTISGHIEDKIKSGFQMIREAFEQTDEKDTPPSNRPPD
jgi:hypothetical protein